MGKVLRVLERPREADFSHWRIERFWSRALSSWMSRNRQCLHTGCTRTRDGISKGTELMHTQEDVLVFTFRLTRLP